MLNDNLHHQMNLLYDYWFTQFDFPNKTGKPYRSSGGKMIWNEELKTHIPEEWYCKQIIDVASIDNQSMVLYHKS